MFSQLWVFMQKFIPRTQGQIDREIDKDNDDFEESRLSEAEESLARLRRRNELILRERKRTSK